MVGDESSQWIGSPSMNRELWSLSIKEEGKTYRESEISLKYVQRLEADEGTVAWYRNAFPLALTADGLTAPLYTPAGDT